MHIAINHAFLGGLGLDGGGSGGLPTQQFSFKAFEGTALRLLRHVKTTQRIGQNLSKFKCSFNLNHCQPS